MEWYGSWALIRQQAFPDGSRMNFQRVSPSSSAALRVERELRRAIIDLELPPGTRLSEQDLATRLGVSRQPVREALIGLAKTRLVEVLPQRGTSVVKISVQKMMEARFVREAIEIAVVRRACEAFDPSARQRIEDLLDTQEGAAREGDHNSFRRYDEMFHMALSSGAGCPMAWRAVEDIKAHMDRVCLLTLPGADAMLPLVEQHRDIVKAIDGQDPDGAEQATRYHLSAILRALPRVEAEHPELFE
jgi:GntR family transcriptional regulator, rspAB operon transcriptional repressor